LSVQIGALKIFCDVARLRSFSRGAEQNEVTQSTASQTVQHLEEHLGVVLIERSHRPLELTREGKIFLEGCREIVSQYEGLERLVKKAHEQTSSIVRVAAIYSVGLGDMSHYIQKFSAAAPQARVQMEYLHPGRVYESVLEEQVDFGIISFPQPRRELTVIPWRNEPMALVCHPGHRLAQEEKVSLKQIEGERFVAFERDLVIRREIDRLLRKHKVSVDVAFEFDNVEAIKRAVEVNSGISILPRPTLEREVSSGALAAVALGTKNLVRPLGIVHRRGKKLYPSTMQFIELLCHGENGSGNHQQHDRNRKSDYEH
jgi:DNA-binding transcriptional LysR family regulator